MSLVKSSPGAIEIRVERAKAMRFAESSGGYDALFEKLTTRWPLASRTDLLKFCALPQSLEAHFLESTKGLNGRRAWIWVVRFR